MANSDIKIALDTYFIDNWTTTDIQPQGQEIDVTAINDFISILYQPVLNDTIGINGTDNGRIRFVGLYKVFCYAKNFNKALVLADGVKSFLNGKQLSNGIYVKIGQDGTPSDLGNGFIEIATSFDVEQWDDTNHSEDYLINTYGITDEDGNFLVDEDGTYLLQDY